VAKHQGQPNCIVFTTTFAMIVIGIERVPEWHVPHLVLRAVFCLVADEGFGRVTVWISFDGELRVPGSTHHLHTFKETSVAWPGVPAEHDRRIDLVFEILGGAH